MEVPAGRERRWGPYVARASYDSVRGRIESGWKIEKGQFALEVTVPVNATAVVGIPAGRAGVREGSKPAGEAEGLRFLRDDGGRDWYEVGSGTYRFTAPWSSEARRAGERLGRKPFGSSSERNGIMIAAADAASGPTRTFGCSGPPSSWKSQRDTSPS